MQKKVLLLFIVFTLNIAAIFAQAFDSLEIAKVMSLSLEEILKIKVVSAGKKEQEINKIPASVVIITKEEIEKFGYTTLQEILNQVPGLYLWDSYHVRGRIDIGIRGFTSSDNVIILVNGVNQIEGVYNEYLLTKVGVPVEAIDRIEVVRGPMSVLYGSGAFFGVINIITDDIQNNSENIVSGLYGSNNTQKFASKIAISSNDLKVGITASGYRTNGMDVAYSKMMSNTQNLTNWGLNPQSTTEGMLKDRLIYYNINTDYKGFKTDMTHTEVERGGFLVQPTVEYSPTIRHSTNFMTSYQRSINKYISLKGKFSYLTTNTLAEYFLNEKNSYVTFGYNSDAIEAELLSFINPHENIDLTLGLFHQNVYYATNPAELEAVWGIPYGHHITRLCINSRMIENSAFAQVDFTPFKNFEFIAGIRLQQMRPYVYEAAGGPPLISNGRQYYIDTFDYKAVYPIPSVSFIYSINSKHLLKLLYGEALRNPPLGQIADILFSTSDNTEVDFPQLVPSKIKTYELNYMGLWGSKFSSQLSLFNNELSNLISQYFLNITDTTTVYYTSNKGEISTLGAELSLIYEPDNKLTLSLSGMYQQSENKTKGLEQVPVPYSPEYTGYFKASYAFYQKLSVFVTGNYIGEMWPEYDYQKKLWLGQKTEGYFVFDAGFKLTNLFVKGITLNLKTTNILNTEIHYPASTLNQFADKGILGYSRRVFVGLYYKF